MITLTLIVLPLVAALVLATMNVETAKKMALGFSLAELGVALFAWFTFKTVPQDSNLKFYQGWMPFNSHFHIDIDGLSILLVLLTALLFPFIMLTAWRGNYRSNFYALAMLMQSALIGVFTAKDGFLFYVFWEIALIPIYFICLMYGGEGRGRITFKFFVYTLGGSLLMLASLLYVYFAQASPSFAIESLYRAGQEMSKDEQGWVFWGLFIAFAIKMPVFPFHTWQPDTYTTAPTAGTMLLSGIMLKMGTFAVVRWLIPIVPEGWDSWSFAAIMLSVVGIIYASAIAIVQKDFKRLIAYSSIAHVGLISAGMFSFNTEGLVGAFLQMVAHGINVVGLFYIVDIIEERTKTREIAALGGIRSVAPRFALAFLIILLGSVALPLTNGFVGEFLLFNGLYQWSVQFYGVWIPLLAGLTVILGAVYMLRSYQTMMLGETNALTANFKDLTTQESIVLYTICGLIIVLGVFPKPLIQMIEPAANQVVTLLQGALIN